jgi:hypothetical protein
VSLSEVAPVCERICTEPAHIGTTLGQLLGIEPYAA